MLFLCVILHTMWLGKSLQLVHILLFGMLWLSAISMFVKIMLAVLQHKLMLLFCVGIVHTNLYNCIS